MGQKVNPHGIRVGVIKDWDSRWFASKKDFSDNLVEDHKIRTELKAQLKDAGVPKIEIERTADPSTSAPRVTVNIYCAKPGMVIGKGGEERVALQNKLTKEYGKTVIVNVIEVKSAATTYGRIGVKVWVYKGEVLKSAKTAQKKEGGNK